jgi:hypothetical protein
MRTPTGNTWAEFSESLREFLDDRCILRENRLRCRDCGTLIEHSRVVVSIHESAFHNHCAAFARRGGMMTLPYCPRCEEKPVERGCLHVSYAELRSLIQV